VWRCLCGELDGGGANRRSAGRVTHGLHLPMSAPRPLLPCEAGEDQGGGSARSGSRSRSGSGSGSRVGVAVVCEVRVAVDVAVSSWRLEYRKGPAAERRRPVLGRSSPAAHRRTAAARLTRLAATRSQRVRHIPGRD
jgi:hypothetical protein